MRQVLPTLLAVTSGLFADPPGATVSVAVNVPAALASGVWASSKTLMLPPGFQISVWARLDGARFMAVAPNGDVFVSQPGGGSVYVYRPVSGSQPTQFLYVNGLNSPHGLAFDTIDGKTYLYVAETNQINRFPYVTGDTAAHDRQVIIKGLPDGGPPELHGSYAHPLKNVAVGPDHRIYVGIGSSCNVCDSDASASPVRGSVYVFNPDGSGGRLFAAGVRNPEGLAFLPGTSTLWAAVNNRDQLPYPYRDASNEYDQIVTGYIDDHPPEPFTHLRDGGNYGWPFCNPTQDGPTGFNRMVFDADLDTNADGHVDCSKMEVIDRGLQAHSAPLQFAFTQNTNFPAVYRSGAIIAFHGSWDRSDPTGYKIAFLPWNESKNVPGTQVDLVAGFREIGSRPAGVAIRASGSLLISDDATGTIFEMTYSAPVVSGANGYAVVAPDSYASVYGQSLSSQTASASVPYPTTLGFVGLQITDSAAQTFQPALFYVSPTQINFLVPGGLATGPAKISIASLGAERSIGAVQVDTTAPALFSMDGTGTGLAAGLIIDSAGNPIAISKCGGTGCVSVPIDLSGGTKYLSLYGTGLRGSATGKVQVLINGTALTPSFAGPQPTFPGLDQVNVELPSALAGSGTVQVQVTAGGRPSNTVTVDIL